MPPLDDERRGPRDEHHCIHATPAQTPDSHDYPTRHYDLVKEFVIALVIMTGLSLVLAGVFSSPDDKAITMASWAKADPADVVGTATGELAGTTTSATYGAPYNHASEGQSVFGLKLQKWGGVGIPIELGRPGAPAAPWRYRDAKLACTRPVGRASPAQQVTLPRRTAMPWPTLPTVTPLKWPAALRPGAGAH